uniref:Uncharacterized protein n=1 Tax=Physcomitrium patens TaxID=3218 RepID=A0A7I4DT79_PHYPA
MERSLLRLAWRARVSTFLQREAALSSQQARCYVASPSSADEIPRSELRQSLLAKTQPVWQKWTKHHAGESTASHDAPQGTIDCMGLVTRKTVAAKRYAVGSSAIDPAGAHAQLGDRESKEKAKEILLEVREKLEKTLEESTIKGLQEKLIATEGIGEVVQELYNQKDENNIDLDLPTSEPGADRIS